VKIIRAVMMRIFIGLQEATCSSDRHNDLRLCEVTTDKNAWLSWSAGGVFAYARCANAHPLAEDRSPSSDRRPGLRSGPVERDR